MSKHTNNQPKHTIRTRSGRVWIEAEMNEELDARKLSRAFLALALHRVAQETAAEAEHARRSNNGGSDECA